MKIALINPPSLKVHGQRSRGFCGFPLGLGYIASYVRARGHEVRIFDPEPSRTPLELMWREVEAFGPGLTGLTSVTPNFMLAKSMAAEAKRRLNCPVIMGGPHANALPRSTLEGITGLDAVILGEGELPVLAIAEALSREGKVDFSRIPGAAFIADGQYRETARSELIQDLDSLPTPARDLVDIHLYDKDTPSSVVRKSVMLISSRGCPSQCTFCANITMGRRFRAHSPEYVVNEMAGLVRDYDIKHFQIVDDCFTADPARAAEICDRIVAARLGVTWFAAARVNTIRDEKLVLKMKRAGCLYVGMGIETGSQHINDLMKKGTTLEMAEQSCALLRKHGIGYINSFIIGNEGDTEETVLATIAFAKKLKPSTAIFNMLIPYPGTPLFEKYYKDYDRPDTNWDYWCSDGLNRPYSPRQTTLTMKRIISLRRRAYRSFYGNPLQLLRTLAFGFRV